MLRKIRIFFSTLFFVCITLLFIDVTGILHHWLGWIAKIQFIPALLALNIGVILAIIIFTIIFGRLYCSVICPLGIYQDIVSWLSSRIRKNRFTYSPALKWMRYTVLVIFIISMLGGITAIVSMLDPYANYGRIASNLFAPLYRIMNNLFAVVSEHFDSYAFYSVDVWIKSSITFILAAFMFILVTYLAWRSGRTYCNTICPVGTVLGFISRFSIYKVAIDLDKCKNCGLCARKCKASCIDAKNHKIDHSRCVVCMDCISNCSFGAITLSSRRLHKKKTENVKVDQSRRSFLIAGAMLAGTSTIKAQKMKVDGGLALIENKKAPARETQITPPGSWSAYNLSQRCTSCQLCISTCPNQILTPSSKIDTLMQPVISYERGYCRPECTKCSEVCPSGAIKPISKEEKSSIQIGHAVWIKENCIPLTDDVECGNCARHCPTGAIQMIENTSLGKGTHKIPAIDTERCIGCGACENLCPARPFSAIYVEGHKRHRMI